MAIYVKATLNTDAELQRLINWFTDKVNESFESSSQNDLLV